MLKIKLNLLKLEKKTTLIKGGASNVVKVANLAKSANNLAITQLKLSNVDTDNTTAMLQASNAMIEAQDTFITKVEKALIEIFKLNKKDVERVMDDTPVTDLMVFVNYVYGRMNGATDEDFEEAPKE